MVLTVQVSTPAINGWTGVHIQHSTFYIQQQASLVQEFQAILGENYAVESVPMTWADGHMIGAIPASGGKGNAGR